MPAARQAGNVGPYDQGLSILRLNQFLVVLSLLKGVRSSLWQAGDGRTILARFREWKDPDPTTRILDNRARRDNMQTQ